jgi:hypothetical protein
MVLLCITAAETLAKADEDIDSVRTGGGIGGSGVLLSLLAVLP